MDVSHHKNMQQSGHRYDGNWKLASQKGQIQKIIKNIKLTSIII